VLERYDCPRLYRVRRRPYASARRFGTCICTARGIGLGPAGRCYRARRTSASYPQSYPRRKRITE